VQYSFPLTYGIGAEGLPSHASDKRRAQARQLKAYLMVFEQLLGNAFAQVAHTADLFRWQLTCNKAILSANSVNGYSRYQDIIRGLDQTGLEEMTETLLNFTNAAIVSESPDGSIREQFSEYTLLLTNFQGQQIALKRLIDDKTAFLKAYPLISHDRGRRLTTRKSPVQR